MPTSAADDAALAPQRSTKVSFLVVRGFAAAGAGLSESVRAWLASAGMAFEAKGLAADSPFERLLKQALSQPQVRVVAFVDNPESAIAQRLADKSAGPAERALGPWRTAARTLLRHWHGNPGRFLLVDASEAARAPHAIEPALKGWAPALRDLPALQARAGDAGPDALLRLIARDLLRSDDEAVGLFDELQACCVALVPSEGEATGTSAGEALQRLRELQGSNASLRRETDELKAKVAALESSAVASAPLSALRDAELAALRTECDGSRLQSGLLLTQINQLQQETEARDLRAKTLEQERDLLLTQISQLQQETEVQYRRANALDREVAGARFGVLPPLRVGAIRVVNTRETAPHRHVHFRVTEARIGNRSLPALQVRLVEHFGRPGLAVFGGEGAEEALGAWQPNGQEGKRPFMLLVPADDASRPTLDHFGTTDWHLVVSLAHRLWQHVYATDGALAARWRAAAARLCRQLDDLPARLRYDQLEASAGPEGALDVTLANAIFGRMPLGTVRMRWHPQRAVLQWLASAEHDKFVPLTGWPVDADGLLLPAETLPVGAGMDSAKKRRHWELLSDSDRMLVMAAVDALSVAAGKGVVPEGAAELESAARALRDDVRATSRRLRARNLARRLLRRPSART